MAPGEEAGLETARILLDIGAVNFRPEEPFTFTSGWASPLYMDCRKLISFTSERRRVMELAVAAIDREIGWDAIDVVAGGETAGIPYAAWIAEATDLPMLYVRKKAKGFGRDAQIEGDLGQGSRTLLVEDLASDGASKLVFVDALRTAGAVVSDTFVIFFYGVFPGALSSLDEAGIGLHYLADAHMMVEAARQGGFFDAAAIAGVGEFLDDPVAWSAAHGGRGGQD